jgi:DNA-directed RNA polymerase specialized sigma24 family protein
VPRRRRPPPRPAGGPAERLSPLLQAHASWRLGPALRASHDPQDLEEDAWAVALPRFKDLGPREGRMTPVLLRFLTTTILYGAAMAPPDDDAEGDALTRFPAEQSGVVTAAARRETQGAVAAALAALDEKDREIILLRGIEQQPNQTVSLLLGLTPQAVAMRYRRALDRLRAHLPRSVFDELDDS